MPLEKDPRDKEHWEIPDYNQRMLVGTWVEILLNRMDTIIFQGKTFHLIAKDLGFGVVEVSKDRAYKEPL